MLPRIVLICLANLLLLGDASGKWVEGHIDTKQNWAFLARFCFLSLDGQFEYLIEYDRNMGIPNLLLYYDDDSQWPSVYHSDKTCQQRENVLNKVGKNQIIKLSHWYPDTELSGCVVRKENKELPAAKSTTTLKPPKKLNATTKNITTRPPQEPSYYDQFLKSTTALPKTTETRTNPTIWYELTADDLNYTTTGPPDDVFWENIGPEKNESDVFENLKDVEILFGNITNDGKHKIKRSTFELLEKYRRRRLNSDGGASGDAGSKAERLVVSCHNAKRFRSARERWWFIAISNCDSPKGLDVRYKFLMTNGPDGDFWHLHFSADEFYVLPILLAYTLAYVVVMIAVVMCSVELKSRHLLHSTYKMFLMSIVAQHLGVAMQSLAYVRYATNGVDNLAAKVSGQFFCGISEMSYLLVLVLMAKGYTITRGRLKVGFMVKLTVFMCCYGVTYIVLFIYQAKAFDPGEVLYLYESPAGYGLIVLRILAWCLFAYSTFFTVRKYPEKNMFYCPFFICGTLWFYAGPLFILTAHSYIDKWVRESVVIAVLLFITFSGHVMFLLLTLPVFANKNFPYHVRTTQIGVMEVTRNAALDGFGHGAYHPTNGNAQTFIIPLTRRTEELIGNMYNQYMATAPPLSLEDQTKTNGAPKSLTSITPTPYSLIQQDSTETNASDDIKPNLTSSVDTETNEPKIVAYEPKVNGASKIFTIEDQVADIKDPSVKESGLPPIARSRRNLLEPIRRDAMAPPPWSLAKGPMTQKTQKVERKCDEDTLESPKTVSPSEGDKKVPSVKNGLQSSSGEISTIHEGHVQSYPNAVSKATIDLFSVKK